MTNKEQVANSVWYAFRGRPFPGGNPAFYNADEIPELEEAKKKYLLIRNEIEKLLTERSGALEPYFDSSLVLEGKWEVIDFYFWGQRNDKNCSACPELENILKNIPGLLSAGLSQLAPHTQIHTHIGDTNAIARCHLGLSIPSGLPDCGLQVNDEKREWKEGEWLVFCDAYPHRAWNNTDKARYVLLIDFILPEFKSQRDEIVKDIRSWMKLQGLFVRRPWIKKLPGKILGMIRHRYKNQLEK
jgi:aspartyl/asparaginyl beta-hydroxylase (cupin superfamily)